MTNASFSLCAFDILVYDGVDIGYWYTWIYSGLIILSI